jgi:hypothetical protein
MPNDFKRKCLCFPTFDVLSHLSTMKLKKNSTNLGFLVAMCNVMKVIDFKIKRFWNYQSWKTSHNKVVKKSQLNWI